ncbi:hypothetical protein EON65_51840 [archaeon]|nr:MAG: hypothetical protein EON65_51840 [archaeon]
MIILSTFVLVFHVLSVESVGCSVDSQLMWNACPLKVTSGQQVRITVEEGQKWNDWYIETTADGYANTFHVSIRFANANLFALICCVSTSDSNQAVDNSCMSIGSNGVMPVAKEGKVACFANDNESMYWNNKGSITAELAIM